MRSKAIRNKRYRKRKYGSLLFALGVILLVFIVYFVSQIEPVKKKYIYPYQHQELVTMYAEANGVSPALVASVIKHESKFAHQAHSPRGAVGLMQLMPETAESLGVNPYDATQNIDGGAKYLKQMLDTFDGDVRKAVAAYNAGPEAVREYGGVPPYSETQQYVSSVLDLYR